jgi:hypothetical protein
MSGTIVFPTNPTDGQLFTANNTTWQWNGTAWVNANTGANFLPTTGGTLTGPLQLAANAASALQATPLQQVQSLVAAATGTQFNVIDNSLLWVNTRGWVSGTALAANAYGLDRWRAGAAGCTMTLASSPAGANAAGNVATITAGSLQQVVEGGFLKTATYTLSWVGTAQGRVGTNPYAASPIQVSATQSTNLTVEFNTGTLSQVQMQLGTIASAYQVPPPGLEQIRCMRYCMTAAFNMNAYNLQGANISVSQWFPVQMRTAPTVTISNQSNSNVSAVSVNTAGAWGVIMTAGPFLANGNGWGGALLLCSADF